MPPYPSPIPVPPAGIPIRWTPKVTASNPFLAPENGDEFLRFYNCGASGHLGRFILVVEGSVPDEGKTGTVQGHIRH